VNVERTTYTNGTPDCFYRDSDHSYWRGFKDGRCSGRLYSPSSISKMADQGGDGLGIWMERQGAYAFRDAIVDTIENIGDPGALTDALSWIDSDDYIHSILAERGWRSSREKSGALGNLAHRAFEDAIRDGEPIEPELAEEPDAVGLLTAVQRFLDQYNPQPIAVEQIVWSPSHNYAGRFDALVDVDGECWLIDLKTSKNVVTNVSYHVQLAGYEIAAVECGVAAPGQIDRLVLVQIGRDGSFDLWDGRATADDFLDALGMFETSRRLASLTRKDKRIKSTKGQDQ
jgi:hypothetical protein